MFFKARAMRIIEALNLTIKILADRNVAREKELLALADKLDKKTTANFRQQKILERQARRIQLLRSREHAKYTRELLHATQLCERLDSKVKELQKVNGLLQNELAQYKTLSNQVALAQQNKKGSANANTNAASYEVSGGAKL